MTIINIMTIFQYLFVTGILLVLLRCYYNFCLYYKIRLDLDLD